MKKRALSLLLAMVMLLSVLPVSALADVGAERVLVDAAGQPVAEVLVPELVTDAYPNPVVCAPEGETYQWQLAVNDDLWVSITGDTERSITLTYAKVNSLLSGGTVDLRCLVDGEAVGPITVATVLPELPEAVPAEESIDLPLEVLSGPISLGDVAELQDGTIAEKHTIKIEYRLLSATGGRVADDYIAEITNGEPFSDEVESPVVVGYEPYMKAENSSDYNVPASTVNLSYDSVEKDDTIIVVYKAAEVNYTVNYYQQNVNNDEYSLFESEIKSGYTGEQVPEIKKTYQGFYVLVYERPEIAANGSTVIDVYYDRYYYLMNFNLDGGYGTEPVYARYGADITVSKPTKPGYTFNGWTINGESAGIPATMPYENRTYVASWVAGDPVNYTVVYWKENADDDGYSYWGQQSKTAAVGSTVSGSDDIPQSIHNDEKQYFTYSAARTDANVVVKGDGSSIVNVYYYRNTYTIYFKGISGRCAIEEHTHGTDCDRKLECLKNVHTHDSSCERILSCGKADHTQHTDTCLICGKTEHTAHSADCCTLSTDHTHTKECWGDVVGEEGDPTFASSNPADGYIYKGKIGLISWSYIYIKGQWYNYSGTASNGDVVKPTCGSVEHTHGDGCTCDLELHTHNDSCYSDQLHTHTDSCYSYTCGMDGHTHVDSCYRACTKLEHTHTNSCNRSISNNVIYVVTAKYEQNIADVWPTADYFDNYSLSGWSIDGVSSTAVSKRVNMTADLCDTSDNLKYAEANESNYDRYLYYMFESFDQSSPANGNDRKYYNGKYYDKSETYYQKVYSSASWNQKQIYGMTPVSNGVVTSGDNVFLYYTRNRWSLSFYNVNATVKTVSSIMFEQPLKDYTDSDDNLLREYTPSYPATLEPNAYVFDGWYTTPECYDGTKFDFTTATMPNSDLTLYAKWAPVTHTVIFYLDKNACDKDEKLTTHEPVEVSHGSLVDPVPERPTNGSYSFVGWFYMNNGEEKAIDFANMPITKDLHVYAKWSSNVLKQYTVQFVLKEDHSVKVAGDITGSGLAGTTKTFDAKGADELYIAYQEGYFPTAQSQSLLLDIDSDNLVLTFEYVQMPAVPYTVKYVDKVTGTSLADDKVVSDNRKAVVTETFKPISGYVPDAYQKRLVITANGENILYFYYSEDEVHAIYQVVHYIRNDDDDGWTEYTRNSITGTIGEYYTASSLTALTDIGYVLSETKYFVSEIEKEPTDKGVQLSADGLSIELYYEPTCIVVDFALPFTVKGDYKFNKNYADVLLTTEGFAKIPSTGYRFYPASNVLYEENYFEADTQTDDRVTWRYNENSLSSLWNDDDVYGYDAAYANATGAQGFYSVSGLNADNLTGKLRTTFYGNGFDLIGNCGSDTGRVLMLIKGATKSYLYDVDTRYTKRSLTQVPLVHAELATEGTYEVIISAGYLAPVAAKSGEQSLNAANAFSLSGSDAAVEQLLAENGLSISQVEYITVSTEDNLTASAASVSVNGTAETNDWQEVKEFEAGTHVEIDAFRVYRSSDNKRYAENEQNVKYANILDVVEGKIVTAYTEGGELQVEVENYESKGGPQRELYLDAGQSVVFGVNGMDVVQVSLRAVSGETKWNGNDITSNTEMYYAVEVKNGTVTVSNTGTELLAIGNVKLKAGTETTATASYSTEVLLRSVRAAMGDAPVESEPQYDPFVDVKVRSTSLLRKKLVTLTITTSTDVETLTVNGYKLYPVNKWMVQSGRATTYTYILADTVSKNTTKTYEITAVNANGQSCTVTKEA